jgi:adenylosuccinate synthase
VVAPLLDRASRSNWLEWVIAVVKALPTRVGAGPFRRSLADESGEFPFAPLARSGHPYRRSACRCGGADSAAPAARRARARASMA